MIEIIRHFVEIHPVAVGLFVLLFYGAMQAVDPRLRDFHEH